MGHRANLILVERGERSVHLSHWGAITIARDLFWGPAHAAKFIRAQPADDESGWLEGPWAEGGAVLDYDSRVLLLFGGDDLRHDVPLRRIYLDMIGRVWCGWRVRWACEGIAELADYVGHPRTRVAVDEDDWPGPAALAPPQRLAHTAVVGSFRTADGALQLFPLSIDLSQYLLAGPRLEEMRQRSTPLDFLPLDEWGAAFPEGGFHVELGSRRMDWWSAKDCPGLPRRVAEVWRGWNVTWHRDGFEFQLESTGGAIRMPARPREAMQRELMAMLLRDDGGAPAQAVRDVAEHLRDQGSEVRISPRALDDGQGELDRDERQRIVAMALGVERSG